MPNTIRRDLLSSLAATVMTSSLSRARAAGTRAAAAASAGRIDTHHHFRAPELVEKLQGTGVVGRIIEWTPARSIEAMDRAEIATAILSGMTGYEPVPPPREEAVSRARLNNEYGARLVADHKGRFGLFATLPLPYIDDSLKEIDYALGTLQADGVFVWTNYGNRWLGDPAFRPVFDELNRRRAVVFSHPLDAPCCIDLQPGTVSQIVEWNTHTSRAIWNLINDGAGTGAQPDARQSEATRYPNVTFVWSHAGGSLLGLAGRMVTPELLAEAAGRKPEKDSALYHLRRFYYDTAAAYNRVQMPALKALVGTSRIVFGSDSPFGIPSTVVQGMASCGFTAAELSAVDRDNALNFLPRWR